MINYNTHYLIVYVKNVLWKFEDNTNKICNQINCNDQLHFFPEWTNPENVFSLLWITYETVSIMCHAGKEF